MSTHAHASHPQPPSLNALAFSATVHCLTGCAIGEVLGMVIGTALGLSDLATIALAVALAFVFGYALTSLPLLRSGLTLAAVAPLAFASDTLAITLMEVVDNAIMLAHPGGHGGDARPMPASGPRWPRRCSIAGAAAYPANRWLPRPRQGPRGRARPPRPLTPRQRRPAAEKLRPAVAADVVDRDPDEQQRRAADHQDVEEVMADGAAVAVEQPMSSLAGDRDGEGDPQDQPHPGPDAVRASVAVPRRPSERRLALQTSRRT